MTDRERAIAERNEQREQFHDLAICTTTLYKDDAISHVRQKLALKLLKNAERLGIRCVVVDGGSNPAFLEQVRAMTNVVLIEDAQLGMGESRRVAFKRAFNIPQVSYVLWTEPEKDDMVREDNIQKMISSVRQGEADIVVPKRQSMSSMPKFQAWIESRANQKASQEQWDLWFGPKLFNRAGGDFFLNYKGDLDKWDAVIKPVLNARNGGKTVKTVEIDYNYDPSQTEVEEDDRGMKQKRLDQYRSILNELSKD